MTKHILHSHIKENIAEIIHGHDPWRSTTGIISHPKEVPVWKKPYGRQSVSNKYHRQCDSNETDVNEEIRYMF